MSDLSKFQQYYNLADHLIEKSSKEDIAETARLLALNVAHYQSKYGELPLDETLAMISMTHHSIKTPEGSSASGSDGLSDLNTR